MASSGRGGRIESICHVERERHGRPIIRREREEIVRDEGGRGAVTGEIPR
ncbi:MAG: hypothetical protein IMF26_11090 [Candidatus Fermentithermobacillus carboniphilus]|uniref:Uncharacterized protein n=1 Tax=Candidatus Fermentithermobacillus carboniphilus TaxID=3085328 RepID=A0AAT9LBS3_9FIRM|nr:MAG: hypothetical protein IMF26_11090 [Candidatus Fermentithermobacillus carboniphilus]